MSTAHKTINPEGLPPGAGFSYAISSTGERTVFFAGHTAMDAKGQIVGVDDIVAQFDQVLKNIETTASAAGVGMGDLTRLRLYVTDIEGYKSNLKEIGAVYRRYFDSYYPAMTLVQVQRLWDEQAIIEIEADAAQ